jgi:hypothetical protein
VLAAKVAVDVTSGGAATVPFRYGRTTNAECTYAGDSRLPGANNGLADIRRVFQTQMGLTMRNAVALLGAHTLGRAEAQFSGFNGTWTTQPAAFTNEYYTALTEDPWNPSTVAGGTQWLAGRRIMLNADMELAYHAVDHVGRCGPVGGNVGRNDCDENDDVADSPHPHTVEFTANQTAWFVEFAVAMQLMTELGHSELVEVEALTSTPTQASTLASTPAPTSTPALTPPPPPPTTSAACDACLRRRGRRPNFYVV